MLRRNPKWKTNVSWSSNVCPLDNPGRDNKGFVNMMGRIHVPENPGVLVWSRKVLRDTCRIKV